jgi:hypothetical protein
LTGVVDLERAPRDVAAIEDREYGSVEKRQVGLVEGQLMKTLSP